jgi:flagellar basal body-associated protein FliL
MSSKKEKKEESKKAEPPKDESSSWLTSLTIAVAVFAAVYAVTMTYSLPLTLFGKQNAQKTQQRFVETLGFNKTTPRIKYELLSFSPTLILLFRHSGSFYSDSTFSLTSNFVQLR